MTQMDLDTLCSLKGKVALVPAIKRHGKMISQGLLQAGAKCIITARKKLPASETAAELSAYGPCFAFRPTWAQQTAARAFESIQRKDKTRLHILSTMPERIGEVFEKISG